MARGVGVDGRSAAGYDGARAGVDVGGGRTLQEVQAARAALDARRARAARTGSGGEKPADVLTELDEGEDERHDSGGDDDDQDYASHDDDVQ